MKKPLMRGLFGISLLCILGFIALCIWWLYRPLNDLEKQLVGTWRHTTGAGLVFSTNADRTISIPGTGATRKLWYVKGEELHQSSGLARDLLSRVSEILRRTPRRTEGKVSIVDSDHFTLYQSATGETFSLERVKPPATELFHSQ